MLLRRSFVVVKGNVGTCFASCLLESKQDKGLVSFPLWKLENDLCTSCHSNYPYCSNHLIGLLVGVRVSKWILR